MEPQGTCLSPEMFNNIIVPLWEEIARLHGRISEIKMQLQQETKARISDLFIEYTGVKPLCTICKSEQAKLRLPFLSDLQEASKTTSILCDKCYESVWKGEK